MNQKALVLTIRNEQQRSLTVAITDRQYEVKTTHPAAPADQLPPLGTLVLTVFEGEELVLTHDAITVRKGVVE
mgnify:CR=1 FL=1